VDKTRKVVAGKEENFQRQSKESRLGAH